MAREKSGAVAVAVSSPALQAASNDTVSSSPGRIRPFVIRSPMRGSRMLKDNRARPMLASRTSAHARQAPNREPAEEHGHPDEHTAGHRPGDEAELLDAREI